MAASSSANATNTRPFSRRALSSGGKREASEYVFFYGHASGGDLAVLSNFYQLPEPLVDDHGRLYPTTEHYMMHGKAVLFEDFQMADAILAASSALEAKKLGRKVRDFDDKVWRSNSLQIVIDGLTLKFDQCKHARDVLLGTRDRILVEAAPRDRIWGIGMGRNNDHRLNPNTWRGENLLGEALMEVRSKLQLAEVETCSKRRRLNAVDSA